MKIQPFGRGIHHREVKGIDRFKNELPNDWYGYTNLDLVIGLGQPREIDLIIVAKRRIFLIDLKDWGGSIVSADGNWVQNGVDRGPSPVRKISGVAREIHPIFKSALLAHPDTRALPVPTVTGLVVMTGNADFSGVAATERTNVLSIDDFLTKVGNDRTERDSFGNVPSEFLQRPLTDPFWREKVARFFKGDSFKPGKRRFQGFVSHEISSFVPEHEIYTEYDAHDEARPTILGTLRLWNFSKCPDTRFQTEEGRRQIAGREQEVYSWLRDRSDDAERMLLPPKIDDQERGVNYWEIYDRLRRMMRLRDFASSEAKRLLPADRIELARQLLAAVAVMHRQGAAHLDLDAHSIWLEAPTTVKLSHLLAARFPEKQSLGKSRYQFLASTKVPEDILGEDKGPKRRDVFQLGVTIHMILFGSRPQGNPPEWDFSIDVDGEFEALHGWLETALEIDAESRFADAVEAHAAFQDATATRPTHGEVITGLESFRGEPRSQRQLFAAYPTIGDPIIESDRVDIWRSEMDGTPVVVKLWKQAAWGDTHREGATVLQFLQRASDQKADRPIGLSSVRDVLWLGDSFALIQDWVEGSTLEELIANPTESVSEPATVFTLMRRLIAIVNALHDEGYGHGDLKPSNIIVTDQNEPVLIDVLDFSPRIDGEIVSSAYAPETGDKLHRDRFAITKIAEELFSLCALPPEHATALASGINDCREKVPSLATLAPLVEKIDAVERSQSLPPEETFGFGKDLRISLIGAEAGLLQPDEGFMFLRIRRDRKNRLALHVRGAYEELVIRLYNDGSIHSAARQQLEQRWIARNAQDEFHKLAWTITIQSSDTTDISDLETLLEDEIVQSRLLLEMQEAEAPSVITEEHAFVPEPASEDDAEDLLAEEIEQAEPPATEIDVPLLWRTLIETENELKTEAILRGDSFYDRRTKVHRAPIELESGTFDYARHDTVGVERLSRRGEWRRIGELDVQASRSDMVVINTNGFGNAQDRWLESGDRLRFISHFEVQSLRRRTDAVERILEGNGRLTELLSVFDPRSNVEPKVIRHELDRELLETYDLNADQKSAFEQLINQRPVGLLQGPPGTGKTRFIAALAHYAISKGLARNVLLTSQSHEAVNTAAESVLRHFRRAGIQPSLLRVAMSEDLVSPDLRPHHTHRVEQALKDRFRASFDERLAIVGKTLGLPRQVVQDIVTLEADIRPICNNIAQLSALAEVDIKRVNSLIDTLSNHLQTVGLDNIELGSEGTDWEAAPAHFSQQLVARISREMGVGADKIERLRSAAGIGRDFMGSVSRAQRSFEAFLAGTRQIVVGTCVGLGRTSLGLTSTAFDLVIVDEAARCTASEILVPLQAARWAVLVGDHAQLKPQHKPEIITLVAERTSIPKHQIQRSDFERVFTTGFGKKAGARLKTQYRMLPPIGRLVSETFYSELQLAAGRTEPEIPSEVLPNDLACPLIWLETDGLGDGAHEQRDKHTHSRTNRAEAEAIISRLEHWHSHEPFKDWLLTQEKHAAGIGIICMYAAQRDLIRRKLRQSPIGYLLDSKIKVGTVDSYQGKENPIIILSLVRNNEFGPLELGSRRIQEGFLSTPNRINVAASRAMDRLIIVGARRRWRMQSPLGQLSAGFERMVAEGEASVLDVSSLLLSEENAQSKKRKKAGHKQQTEVVNG